MKRVTSRPRLVSWDAFEATSPSDDGKSENADHDVSLSEYAVGGTLGRKRIRDCQSPFDVIPVLDCEKKRLQDLAEDIVLHTLSFLSPSDARSLSSTCHEYRQLLQSRQAHHLWVDWCVQKWPMLSLTKQSNEKLVFRDDLFLPCTFGGFKNSLETNLSLLLGLSSRYHPETVILQNPLFSRTKRDGVAAVEFNGEVGFGDRCFRSDQPLPRPVSARKHRFGHSSLCPMVAPYVTAQEQVQLTPRLISYYEVTVLPSTDQEEARPSPLNQRRSDCVAVGLATSDFQVDERMPGWDSLSYGYHGDDGGIYHGSGHTLMDFGPRFTEGDVVGCGVDHLEKAIFYTLNGMFLGHAFYGVPRVDLYPTVGVDTHCFISCNFGDRPFAFDLTNMIKKQQGVVERSLLPLLQPGQPKSPKRKFRRPKILFAGKPISI